MDARSLTRSLLALLTIAACSGGDDAVPPPSTPPSTTSTSSSTSTSTTSTTSTTTTTTIPGTAAAAATCTTLQLAPWPDRRGSIMVMTAQYLAEGGTGALVDAVRAMCPEDLARQEAAAALEQRVAALNDTAEALTGADVNCTAGSMIVTWTNGTSDPIGLALHAANTPSSEQPAQGATTLWSLGAGQSLPVAVPIQGDSWDCSLSGRYFLADPGPADATIPGGDGPSTTGDDPAVWLPAVVATADVWWLAPSASGVDSFTDLRSSSHSALASVTEPDADVHPLAAARVCDGTVDQPDPDHVAFAYFVEYGPATVAVPTGVEEHPGFSRLLYGAFRRGSDGRWRYLTHPLPLDGSLTGAGCGAPVPHP